MKYVFSITMMCLILAQSCVSDKKEHDVQKIKVAQFGEVFLYMPLYLADSRGFFKEEGLEIELINTGGDDKTFAAVISGSAKFGIADPTFVAIAAEKGQGGKVIASVVNGVPFWGVTKKTNIPEMTNASQLKGYSVATFPSPSTAYTLQYKMFKDAGLEPNIKQGAFGTLLAMLDAEEADIALELEPNVSTAVQQGARVVYSLAEIYGDFAITGVTTNDITIKQEPELVQRFVNALNKAQKYAHNHPDSAAYYASLKFPDMNKTVILNAMNRIVNSNTLPHNVVITEAAWEKATALRYDVGDIQSMQTAKSVLDMQFANKAVTSK